MYRYNPRMTVTCMCTCSAFYERARNYKQIVCSFHLNSIKNAILVGDRCEFQKPGVKGGPIFASCFLFLAKPYFSKPSGLVISQG